MEKMIFREEYLELIKGLDTFDSYDVLIDIINYGLFKTPPQSDCGKVAINVISNRITCDKAKNGILDCFTPIEVRNNGKE